MIKLNNDEMLVKTVRTYIHACEPTCVCICVCVCVCTRACVCARARVCVQLIVK